MAEGEHRVALHPEMAEKLIKRGAEVNVARGAGEKSGFSDEMYSQVGAKLVDIEDAWKQGLVLKVQTGLARFLNYPCASVFQVVFLHARRSYFLYDTRCVCDDSSRCEIPLKKTSQKSGTG